MRSLRLAEAVPGPVGGSVGSRKEKRDWDALSQERNIQGETMARQRFAWNSDKAVVPQRTAAPFYPLLKAKNLGDILSFLHGISSPSGDHVSALPSKSIQNAATSLPSLRPAWPSPSSLPDPAHCRLSSIRQPGGLIQNPGWICLKSCSGSHVTKVKPTPCHLFLATNLIPPSHYPSTP